MFSGVAFSAPKVGITGQVSLGEANYRGVLVGSVFRHFGYPPDTIVD
jgi:hypothetical protein